jgi:hypothetical protein
MLDELTGRIFPSLRTATRSGRIPVYDFRLRQSSGVETACILKGPLIGTVPVVGDMLTLNGRARSGSMFWVRDGRIENVNTVLGTQQRYSGFFFVLTVVMMTFFILFLQGALDQWLYPHLEKIILNST